MVDDVAMISINAVSAFCLCGFISLTVENLFGSPGAVVRSKMEVSSHWTCNTGSLKQNTSLHTVAALLSRCWISHLLSFCCVSVWSSLSNSQQQDNQGNLVDWLNNSFCWNIFFSFCFSNLAKSVSSPHLFQQWKK